MQKSVKRLWRAVMDVKQKGGCYFCGQSASEIGKRNHKTKFKAGNILYECNTCHYLRAAGSLNGTTYSNALMSGDLSHIKPKQLEMIWKSFDNVEKNKYPMKEIHANLKAKIGEELLLQRYYKMHNNKPQNYSLYTKR